MIKLSQKFAYWLRENHAEIYTLVLLGHTELVTPAMAKAYVAWSESEDGRKYAGETV